VFELHMRKVYVLQRSHHTITDSDHAK